MGTRNLTMVISKGETKVAQYGQWDGYPEGQGKTILEFLKSVDLTAFMLKLETVKFVDDEKQKEIDEYNKSIGCEGDWVNMEQSALIKKRYPLFSRDNGGAILDMIMDCEDNEIWLYDDSSFAGDGLSNEWTYVIDLDKGTFEVYEGFNKEPLKEGERFYHLKAEYKASSATYYAVKHRKTYFLIDLPETAQFIKDFDFVEEEN